MSSNTKDPLQEQDTPSESSESHSDSEVNETEENLEHLKIQERQTKNDSEESKHTGFPDQGVQTSNDSLNEPIAGPSGLQELRPDTSHCISDAKSKIVIADPQKGQDVKAKDVDLNIEERMAEGESNTTNSTPPSIQSSTGETSEKSPVAEPSRPKDDVETSRGYSKYPLNVVYAIFARNSSQSSSSRRFSYASDSANTSSDVSDMRSEAITSSTDENVYHDALDRFEREESPSYASAVERQTSESSDANISEIQDDALPSRTPSISSVSISTPTEEQGGNFYMAQIEREAQARGEAISTSSGIGSTDQSELAARQRWEEAGAIGFIGRNVDDPHQNVSDHDGEPRPIPESSDSEEHQQNQVFDRLFQEEQLREGNMERLNEPEGAVGGCVPRRTLQACAGAGSPSKRRRQSDCLSDSSREEKEIAGKSRPRFKPVTGRKSRSSPRKPSLALQSSSESTEPKSSSSEDSRRKESLELDSSSEAKESSKFEKGRKSWQKSGLLRGMQISTMSSKDSIIAEEEDATLEEKDPELMETNDPIPEKMETTPEKNDAEADKNAKPSEFQHSIESADQACGFQTEGTSREREESFDVSDFERSVGKSKRDPKLSNSPPSDEMVSSSPPKAETSRPKKKARSDKNPGKTRRTRHDSGGTVPKSVDPENTQQSESTSDYSASEGENSL